MKVLMLADVFFPDTIGGAGRVLYHLSLELSKKGHEIHILTRNSDGKLPSDQDLKGGLFVHRFFSPQGESLISFLSEIKNSYLLAKELARAHSFDLVCVHQSLVAIGPLLLPALRHVPMAYYFHSPWFEEFLVKRQGGDKNSPQRARIMALAMKWIERRILFLATKVVVLSQYMSDKLLHIHHYPPERILRIPGGVDIDHFAWVKGGKARARAQMALPAGKPIFLTVRNLVPRMGIENLVEAFHQSKTLRDRAILLIGGNGFLEAHLKSRVSNLDLQGCIHFLGHVPEKDLPKLYQAADFFVLPTRELEGFGLVILEALASGTPVLGTPVGAIPEIIGLLDDRLMFEGTSWEKIQKKLEEVVEEPNRYHIEPSACRKLVEEGFQWKAVAEMFEKEFLSKPPSL